MRLSFLLHTYLPVLFPLYEMHVYVFGPFTYQVLCLLIVERFCFKYIIILIPLLIIVVKDIFSLVLLLVLFLGRKRWNQINYFPHQLQHERNFLKCVIVNSQLFIRERLLYPFTHHHFEGQFCFLSSPKGIFCSTQGDLSSDIPSSSLLITYTGGRDRKQCRQDHYPRAEPKGCPQFSGLP